MVFEKHYIVWECVHLTHHFAGTLYVLNQQSPLVRLWSIKSHIKFRRNHLSLLCCMDGFNIYINPSIRRSLGGFFFFFCIGLGFRVLKTLNFINSSCSSIRARSHRVHSRSLIELLGAYNICGNLTVELACYALCWLHKPATSTIKLFPPSLVPAKCIDMNLYPSCILKAVKTTLAGIKPTPWQPISWQLQRCHFWNCI